MEQLVTEDDYYSNNDVRHVSISEILDKLLSITNV